MFVEGGGTDVFRSHDMNRTINNNLAYISPVCHRDVRGDNSHSYLLLLL